jgi:CheY-like chemotaxis protein
MAQDGVTILIVDDDAGHVELVRRHLRRACVDARIDTVSSGSEALDYAFGHGSHPSASVHAAKLLLLLDINMTGDIDGVEVLRRLKSDRATRKIPVVMLTTTDDPREIDRCYELGCNMYLTKSIDPSAFVVAINRLGSLLSVMSMPTNVVRRP